MSGPFSAPWTDIGRLQSDIQSLESKIREKASSHEVLDLRSTISRLESRMTELERSLANKQSDDFHSMNRITDRITALENQISEREQTK